MKGSDQNSTLSGGERCAQIALIYRSTCLRIHPFTRSFLVTQPRSHNPEYAEQCHPPSSTMRGMMSDAATEECMQTPCRTRGDHRCGADHRRRSHRPELTGPWCARSSWRSESVMLLKPPGGGFQIGEESRGVFRALAVGCGGGWQVEFVGGPRGSKCSQVGSCTDLLHKKVRLSLQQKGGSQKLLVKTCEAESLGEGAGTSASGCFKGGSGGSRPRTATHLHAVSRSSSRNIRFSVSSAFTFRSASTAAATPCAAEDMAAAAAAASAPGPAGLARSGSLRNLNMIWITAESSVLRRVARLINSVDGSEKRDLLYSSANVAVPYDRGMA